jgi:hypothetical protein
LSSYGYLTVVASATELTFAFTEVKEDGTSSPFDKKITVNLANNTIS